MADETIGTAQTFANPQAFHDDIGADVDVGAPRTGLLSVDEELGSLVASVSNANNAPHTLGAATAVRHDGSGAQSGARMRAGGSHCIAISTNHFTIQDLLLSANASTKACIIFTSGGDNCTIQRNALVQEFVTGDTRTVTAANGADNNNFYFNNMFIAGANRICVLNVSNGGKVYCNTFIFDDSITGIFGFGGKVGQQDLRGNIVVAKNAVPSNKEYLNVAGAAGSTQNAGEDGSAAIVGSADIDFTDDLSITYAEIVENRTLATINMLRKSANHGDMPITDLSAVTGILDVRGIEFDPAAMVAGAHQLDIVLPGGAGAVPPFENPSMGPVANPMAGAA